jgi:hypothetical protein
LFAFCPLKAGLLLKHFEEEGCASSFEIDLGPLTQGVDFTAFSAADKAYAIGWQFKYASNPVPPDDFTDTNGYFSQSEFDTFTAEQRKTRYKLLNHCQIKYLITANSEIQPGSLKTLAWKWPNDIFQQVLLGNTRDPSRVYEVGGILDTPGLWLQSLLGNYPGGGYFPAKKGPSNWKVTETSTQFKVCNEGQPDKRAMTAFNNVYGPGVNFFIWSSITFFSDLTQYGETMSPSSPSISLTRNPKPSNYYQGRINSQMYPTYWVYINGRTIPDWQTAQNPNPLSLLLNTDKCQ